MTPAPVLLDSITNARDDARGRVVVSGSHGGLYPASMASRAGVLAAIFNDAGIGRDEAGLAGVVALAEVAAAAAAADCMSCRIGDAADMMARGRISRVNAVAGSLGVEPGATVAEAAAALAAAPPPRGALPAVREARRETRLGSGLHVVLVDSASLVAPEDAGAVVVTGSHGGLIGGDPARALKARARVAAFNDAGLGPDEIGASRLPALDARGVAAVVVSAESARIGEAASTLEDGVISRANSAARRLGARPGVALRDWLLALPPG